MMASAGFTKHFRLALLKVSEVLTKKDVQDLAFLCPDITPAKREQLENARELFSALQGQDLLNERKVDILIESLDELKLHEASKLLEDYKRDHLQSGAKLPEKCYTHGGLPMKYYCGSCDKTLCPECVLTLHGEGTRCDVITLEKFPEEIAERRQKLNEKIKGVTAVVETTKQLWEGKKSFLAKCRDRSREEALNDYSELLENAEKKKQSVTEQLGTIEVSDSEQLLEEWKQLRGLRKDVEILEKLNRETTDYSLHELQKVLRATKEIDEISTKQEEHLEEAKKSYVGNVYRKVGNDGTFGVMRMSTLVGSVMLRSDQIVHVSDERQISGGVSLVCVNPCGPSKEWWRHSMKVDDETSPLVMSCVDASIRVLFAVGNVVNIVRPAGAGVRWDWVDNVASVEIGDVTEGSWITSVVAHCMHAVPCDKFLISLNNSKTIREYKLTGEALRVMEVNDFILSDRITCMSYCGDMFAIIDRERGDVILLSYDGTLKQCGTLHRPSAALKPTVVLWSGSSWLALWIGTGAASEWKVTVNRARGALVKVRGEGTSSSDFDVPVGISRYGGTPYVTISNSIICSFE